MAKGQLIQVWLGSWFKGMVAVSSTALHNCVKGFRAIAPTALMAVMRSSLPDVEFVIDSGVRVLIYDGDAIRFFHCC